MDKDRLFPAAIGVLWTSISWFIYFFTSELDTNADNWVKVVCFPNWLAK
jgi:hypothetical protein